MAIGVHTVSSPRSLLSGWLRMFGDAMQRHRRAILVIQWAVVAMYLVLVAGPVFLDLPPPVAHVYDNLTLFAQFLFWGIWWPFVMVSMMFMGRVWCGVFCPEGALTEFVSKHGLGRKIPKWLRWGGWPFVAFSLTTIVGQLVSVYEYPKPTLLILGGSTVAAIGVGYVFGRGKRVWCRYLCPANGIFRILARVAPVHFQTDRDAWRAAPPRTPAVNCAPLVDIRHLSSMSECHACGRCSGHRNAVHLEPRSPNSEVLALKLNDVSRWEAMTMVFGVFGIALGAFQWSASPWFASLKTVIATWLIEHDMTALLANNAPWWLLTHYPEANDTFTWLDGILIVAYMAATAALIGTWILGWLRVAQASIRTPGAMWRLTYSLIPLAGVTVFVGLSLLTVTMLRAEGLTLAWVMPVRWLLIGLAVAWSAWLALGQIRQTVTSPLRKATALLAALVAMSIVPAAWAIMFFYW